MALYRLLQNSAFGPDDIQLMVTAYESALRQLGLRGGVDPVNEIIARLIVEVAQTGEKDPKAMCAAALSRIDKAA